MSADKVKEQYRAAVAKLVAKRDAALAAAGDEDARVAAIAEFDEANASLRAQRATALAEAEA